MSVWTQEQRTRFSKLFMKTMEKAHTEKNTKKPCFSTMTTNECFYRAMDEMDELVIALEEYSASPSDATAEEVMSEVCDVINFMFYLAYVTIGENKEAWEEGFNHNGG